jgi:hypothetical protein
MGKSIKFTVGKDETTVAADGFQGKGCESAIKDFLAGMGADTVGEPEPTEEYHQTESEYEEETE